MRRMLFAPLAALWATLLLVACGGGASNSMGATPGGIQDMHFARELVEQGMVPPAEAFVVEGMFSEHDLALDGAGCQQTLCLQAKSGVAPGDDGAPSLWVQLGMSSNVDPDTFMRPSVSVIATVDVSGSMGWGYAGNDTPGEVARTLLSAISQQLNSNDRVAIVTYGSGVDTVLDLTAGGDPKIAQAIASLSEGGATDMEAGLRRAYELAQGAIGKTEEVRVLLFTDVQPNVGATQPSEFQQIVAAGAQEGVGISIFALGLGIGQELLTAIAPLRGGNAFSLMSAEEVPSFMDDNWPWMVSPIAYDLRLSESAPNLALRAAYGFPKANDAAAVSLEVATVFLSKNRGALLLELRPEQGGVIPAGAGVDLTISYTDRDGASKSESLTAAYDGSSTDERGVYMEQPSVYKATALALLVVGMRHAAKIYSEDSEAAVASLESTLARFLDDALAIGDPDISAEAEFWPKLLGLMQEGAPQGTFYGAY